MKNFVAVVGDRPLPEITGDDMLNFRDWWIERIADEDLTPNSANKDLIHLGKVLKTVNRMKRLNLVLPLSDLSLKEGEAKKRPPFSATWIRERLLKPGALDGLNEEAKAIFLVMVNTGCRPSEIAALTPGTIHLRANVPHISIEPIGRQLKSRRARRKIALTGVSLEAVESSSGFPRYRDKAGLSGAVNKFLRENGLMKSDSHSLYSLRHAFEDRLLAAKVDERVRRDLMGHRLSREEYGEGATLDYQRRNYCASGVLSDGPGAGHYVVSRLGLGNLSVKPLEDRRICRIGHHQLRNLVPRTVKAQQVRSDGGRGGHA